MFKKNIVKNLASTNQLSEKLLVEKTLSHFQHRFHYKGMAQFMQVKKCAKIQKHKRHQDFI